MKLSVPGVVTTAASGNPFPIPLAMVTEDKGVIVNRKLRIFRVQNILCDKFSC